MTTTAPASLAMQKAILRKLLLIVTVLWLYLAARFVFLLPVSLPGQCALALLLLALAQYQQISGRYFGGFASPELPRGWLVLLGWAFGSLLLLVFMLLARDAAGLILWVFSGRLGLELWTNPWLNGLLGIWAGLLGAWGTWQGIKAPDVKRVHIRLTGLPAAFEGYRIVQLSDLHAHGLLPASWQQGVVNKTNALQADLIVITGDLQDGTPAARAADIRPLANLKATDGVLAIVGNHEYYEDFDAWLKVFAQLGLDVLLNSSRIIERSGQTLAIVGLTDRQARAFDRLRPNLQQALQDVPPQTPIVLLEHQPLHARKNADVGVALQLSGHTHGGQIAALSFSAKKTNNGFLSGLYQVGGMQLYVSNGTDLWNGLILRLGRPSEITELVLECG